VSRSLPTVAIVGRPNVGKSAFFNRVLGRRHAIVEDVEGVTRDRNFARTDWAGHSFFLVDTGGLELDSEEQMAAAVRRQVMAAIEEADVIVFLVDGRTGPHPVDQRVVEILRRTDRPVVLAVNKMDRLPDEVAHHEFWELGLGEPIPVSSIVGKGSGDLLDAIVARLPDAPGDEDTADTLYVAVIGRPNVGKSSFINRLLGEERLVVSETAGTTRDTIDTPFRYHGRDLMFVDTAGLRRQARIDPGLEYYASLRTERAIERADVCMLLIEASQELHIQDMRIAEMAWKNGCGLVLVANKWDVVEKDDRTAIEYERTLRSRAPSLKSVPIVFTSAISGQRVRRALDVALEVADARATRIPTNEVNEVLRELASRLPPPHHRGMPVKLMYAAQVSTKPPTFVVFVNHPKGLKEPYLRYLRNGFREHWGFAGTPLRVRIRARRGSQAE
jgi:GTP-binding protein